MPQPDLFNPPDNELSSAKIQLLMALRSKGVRHHAVLSAIESVPREAFVPKMFAHRAYDNADLPMSAGQTISAPLTIARMLEALQIDERSLVLEVGTGSGYQAAIMAKLARRVFTIEHHRELREEAQERFCSLNMQNVTSLVGDGHKGWRDAAPYDRIMVTAAAKVVPSALLEQLADGGILLIPIGQAQQPQRLFKITRDKWNYHREELFSVSFDPLIEPPK